MDRKLGDSKIGEWILSVDLLGTAQDMSENMWFDSLIKLLDSILFSVNILNEFEDITLIQYGDTLSFCHYEPQPLIDIGIKILINLFDQDIMAQAGLSGADGYYIDDSKIHELVKDDIKINLNCFVGPGFARSHCILRGIYGHRFLLDEEGRHVPINSSWDKLLGPQDIEKCQFRVSEIRWWKDISDIKDKVNKRLQKTEIALCELKAEKEEFPFLKIKIDRSINSNMARIKHLKKFQDILSYDLNI